MLRTGNTIHKKANSSSQNSRNLYFFCFLYHYKKSILLINFQMSLKDANTEFESKNVCHNNYNCSIYKQECKKMENAHEVSGSATQSRVHASMQAYTYAKFFNSLLKTLFSVKLRLSRRINYEIPSGAYASWC